jgi:hypothetical protein
MWLLLPIVIALPDLDELLAECSKSIGLFVYAVAALCAGVAASDALLQKIETIPTFPPD